jgi:ABC-type transport system substrate-binding protein
MLIGLTGGLLTPSQSDVVFSTHGGMNFFGYSNPQVDSLFIRAKSKEALDPNDRKQIYAELSQVLSDEQPVDFLVFRKANIGLQKNVQGVEPGISMGYNYYLWHFGPAE